MPQSRVHLTNIDPASGLTRQMSTGPQSGASLCSIAELCKVIIDLVQLPDPHSRESFDSLLALACVSRSLSELALDALWSDLHGLDAIARLIPPHIYDSKTEVGASRSFSACVDGKSVVGIDANDRSSDFGRPRRLGEIRTASPGDFVYQLVWN